MALQAIGSCSICISCQIVMVSIGFSGHIRVIMLTGAVTGVVSIQTSRVI